ncbi:MAG: hypothetical protein ACHQJ6_07275 [Candidatus Berkiellales bacterium]
MRRTVTNLTLIFLCLPLMSVAQESAPPSPPIATTIPFAVAKPGNKKDWAINVQKNLPALLCEQDHYFVKCFDVTQKDCTDFNQLLVQACLNNIIIALPPTLSDQEGEYWGQMVARCAYDLYEKHMQSKKRTLQNCQEVPPSKDDLPKPSQAIP